jgi:hypothetical protein
MPPRWRRPALAGVCLVVLAAVAPGRGHAAADPGFCDAIVEVVQAGRNDFDRWRGQSRKPAGSTYDAERTLPRADDCRIERASGETRYTCEWEYQAFEEASARAAAERFLDGILDCLGNKIWQVEPYRESATGRRQTTRLVVRDDATHSAELRISSGIVTDGSAWYVEFSANPTRAGR